MNAEVLEICRNCTQKTRKLEEEAQETLLQKIVPSLATEFAPLLAERQPFLDAKEGLWTSTVLSRNAATSQFCSDIDHKVLRALESVRVTKKVENLGTPDVKIIRTVTFKLRPSIFCGGGELSRTMSSDGETISATGVEWKVPERSRPGTILRVFEKDTPSVEAKLIMDAVDEIYQNPIIAAGVSA